MHIKALRNNLVRRLKRANLEKKFCKQKKLFERDYRHPSLNTEKLRPYDLGLYSFRIDRKWRAILIVINKEEVEIVDINPHSYRP